MSLISDALKKTQRMRTGEPVDIPAGTMPASRPGRGGSSGPTLVWVIAGAIVLVCAAVVTTVFLVRPPAAPALAQAKSAPAPAAANTAAPPAVLAPVVAPPAPKPVDATPAMKTEALKSAPASAGIPVVAEAVIAPPGSVPAAPAKIPPLSPAPRPAAGSPRQPPLAATVAPAGVAAQPDPRIQTFIDTIKVAGIRSSGTDSKVLMNDKVYRVNDIVDRSLNLRLIEVQSDSLTFVDENGVTYIKDHF